MIIQWCRTRRARHEGERAGRVRRRPAPRGAASLALAVLIGAAAPASAQVGQLFRIEQLRSSNGSWSDEKHSGPVDQVRLLRGTRPCHERLEAVPGAQPAGGGCSLIRLDSLARGDTLQVSPLWRARVQLLLPGANPGLVVMAPELTTRDRQLFDGLRWVPADPSSGGGSEGSYTVYDDPDGFPRVQLHSGTLIVWRWRFDPVRELRIDVAAGQTRNRSTSWAIGVDSVRVEVDPSRAVAERYVGRDSIEAHAWLFVRDGTVEITHPAAEDITTAVEDQLWMWTESTPPWLHGQDEVPPGTDLVENFREGIKYNGEDIWKESGLEPYHFLPLLPAVLCLLWLCNGDDVQGEVGVIP